MQGAGGEQGPP